MTTNIIIILVTSALIWVTGQWFIQASSRIGDYFRLPRSVKGATLDAISSSFPELMIALFAVIAFQHFEVGVGTIAGSALFNLLIITGISVLVAPKAFKVSRNVVMRDGVFYIISVATLLIALFATKTWTLLIPLSFILIYLLYFKEIVHDVHEFHKETARKKKKHSKIKLPRELTIAIICMLVIGFASYFLTEHAIAFAEAIHVSPLVIAFTVMAAATSLPDAVISIGNARKGHIDDATSNVFGSNIFDILIGLSIPILLAIFLTKGPVQIQFDYIEIVIGLLGSTLLLIYFLTGDYTLRKWHGGLLLAMYGAFLGYVILL